MKSTYGKVKFWRPLRTPPLFNCCRCLHPMRAGAAGQRIRLRVLPAGRLGGIVRCGCNLSLAARMAYLMYVGGRMVKSAPQIAIPPSRPATPRTHTRFFASSFLLPGGSSEKILSTGTVRVSPTQAGRSIRRIAGSFSHKRRLPRGSIGQKWSRCRVRLYGWPGCPPSGSRRAPCPERPWRRGS